jgi:hypothetical protein
VNHLIKKATIATVRVPLPENAPVASAAAALYDRNGDAVASFTDTTPAVYSYALKTSAPSAGDRTITIDWSTSPVLEVGDELFIADLTAPIKGPLESVVIKSITGEVLTLEKPLVFGWDIGDLVHTHFIDVDLNATDTASLGRNFRLELTLTLTDRPAGKNKLYKMALIDVVNHLPGNTLTVAELRRRLPSTFSELAGSLDKDDSGFDTLIEEAFRITLRDVNRKVAPDLVMSDDGYKDVTLQKVLELMAEDGRFLKQEVDRLEVIETYKGNYVAEMDAMLGSVGWVDSDQDGAVEDGEERASLHQRVTMDPY